MSDIKKKQPLQHASMDQFANVNGELSVDGKMISQIAMLAGQTPFYVYDKHVISENIHHLRDLFPQVSLHFAIKANPFPPLISFIADFVDGLDVASAKELHTALATSTTNDNISFAGPGKSINELKMALASGITINVESYTELQRIELLAKETHLFANIALRLNPDFELKSSGMKMGGGSQQFGIDVEQLEPVFELIKSNHLILKGLHIFTGSQNLNPEAIISAHDNIFELVIRLISEYNFKIEHLNIGGGFGIPYFPGEKCLDLKPVSDNLKQLLSKYHAQLNHCEIILELGRYIVGNAGLLVCQITDKKVSRGETFLIANSGLHHQLAASGNFGQIIRKNYPTAIANKMESDEYEIVNIVGPLCTPLDILANKVQLPKAEIGDFVAVYQSGAYGYSASPRDFLSHPHPVEILL